jgi:hypothetical protein
MYRYVAQNARLEEAGLVMKRRCAWCAAEARLRVALQAEQVNIAQLQHVRIGSTVDAMASLAPVHLNRRVLVDEWPLFVGVALKADCIL